MIALALLSIPAYHDCQAVGGIHIMVAIALFGAGGKMGARLSRNLKSSEYDVRHVELGEAGRARLKDELGIACVDKEAALDNVDVVILAVPDTHIGKVAHDISPLLKSGTMVVALDGAAPFAGHLPKRDDMPYRSEERRGGKEWVRTC